MTDLSQFPKRNAGKLNFLSGAKAKGKTIFIPPNGEPKPAQSYTASANFDVECFGYALGLKSNQVHQTICSQDGRIWSATPVGLACYDGVSVVLFGPKHGLDCHGLRAIAIAADNKLWLGSDVGIELLDISDPDPKILWSERIGTVECLESRGDDLVIGTTKGLFFWTPDYGMSRSDEPRLQQANINSIALGEADHIWLTSPDIGLATLVNGVWEFFDTDKYQSLGRLCSLASGPDKSIMVGGDQGAAKIAADGSIEYLINTDSPTHAIIWHAAYILLGTGAAVLRINTNNTASLSAEVLLDDVSVRHLMIDKFDNLWISTDDKGLQRISVLRRIFEQSYDVDIGAAFCIENSTTGLLVGGSRGLCLPDGKTTLNGIKIWDVFEDHFGKIWAATEQGLYCRVNPHYMIPYRHDVSTIFAAPCRSLISFKGELYVGSIRGLAKLGSFGPEEIYDTENESLGYVYSLHIGPFGNLWIATLGNGLWRYDGKALTKIADGSISDRCNVYAICHSNNGEVFVAHDDRLSRIGANGIPELFVESQETVAAWALEAIQPDLIVAGSSGGLIFYSQTNGRRVRRISNSTRDKNWEFTTSRSIHLSEDGKIYCGTSAGLRSVDLKQLSEVKQKPEAVLGRVKWTGVTSSIQNKCHVVKYGKWRVEIGLRLFWYLDEHDCKMKFRLKGFDSNWPPNQPLGPIQYTSLPPGEYALDVQITSAIFGPGPVRQIINIRVIE